MTIKQAIKFCKAKDLCMVAGYLKDCVETNKKFKQKVKYDFNENHLLKLEELCQTAQQANDLENTSALVQTWGLIHIAMLSAMR